MEAATQVEESTSEPTKNIKTPKTIESETTAVTANIPPANDECKDIEPSFASQDHTEPVQSEPVLEATDKTEVEPAREETIWVDPNTPVAEKDFCPEKQVEIPAEKESNAEGSAEHAHENESGNATSTRNIVEHEDVRHSNDHVLVDHDGDKQDSKDIPYEREDGKKLPKARGQEKDTMSELGDDDDSEVHDNDELDMGEEEVEGEEEDSQKKNSGRKKRQAMNDDDDEEGETSQLNREIVYPDESPIYLEPGFTSRQIGTIKTYVEPLYIIQSNPGVPPYDIGAIICLQNNQPIGRIFDVFGPIENPVYSVRRMATDKEPKDKLGSGVSIVIQSARVIIPSDIYQKGSDASFLMDEEMPENLQDFSDDEKEMLANKGKKKSQRQRGRDRRVRQRTDEHEAPVEVEKDKQDIQPAFSTTYQTTATVSVSSFFQSE